MSTLDLINRPLAATLCIAIPLVGGTVCALSVRKSVDTWYKVINKPPWTPPNWLFGPAWTYLYITMGYASYRVLTCGNLNESAIITALSVYGAQLLLNFTWSHLFFGFRQLGASFAVILSMLGLITASTVLFFALDPVAGGLMIPYIIWVTYATSLNGWIWWYNSPGK